MKWRSPASGGPQVRANPVRRLRRTAVAGALGVACLFAGGAAQAHIILISDGGADTPKDWQVYSDVVGDPQKPTPCGNPSPSVPTNSVLTVHPGQTVTVSWTEAVAHSGHFRIVLAPLPPGVVDAGVLPDPVVTQYADSTDKEAISVQTLPVGATVGSSGTIVLADNLFGHCIALDPCDAGPTVAAGQTYTTTVVVPNVSCTNCTLQLVQFMAYHGADPSFFYHHCATTTIVGGDAGFSEGDGSAAASESSGTGSGAAGGSGGSQASLGAGAGSTGGQAAGGSNASAGNTESTHSGGAGCGIATGAASVPAALVALSFAFARRRRARRRPRSG